MPLGMEDGRILPGHLRASSSYNYNHGPDRARLNIYASHGRTGAWVAKYRNTRQFLQIDLRQLSIIKGIATQGRREAHQWVISYVLSYSKDGRRFRAYTVGGRLKVFKGFVLWYNSSLLTGLWSPALAEVLCCSGLILNPDLPRPSGESRTTIFGFSGNFWGNLQILP